MALKTILIMTFEVFLYMTVITRANEHLGPSMKGNFITLPKMPEEMPRDSPCPEAEDIDPCQCSSDGENNMFMDCSRINSEEELRNIFSQEFPFTNFSEFKIYDNENLETLEAGDLGNSSFVKVDIYNTQLRSIDDLALVGSSDTLEMLYLRSNKLDSMPDISVFRRLTTIIALVNNMTVFPVLKSTTIEYLDLSANPLQTVPVGAISGMPSLYLLYLGTTPLSHLDSGTFSSNGSLSELNLSYNNLTTIPYDAIRLHGPQGILFLQGNQIANVSVGSFTGVTSYMFFNDNNLTELEEDVWRPLLEDDIGLWLGGNPYGCGCDIAWLIVNGTLLDRVSDMPTCSDGTAFDNLDPAIYEEMCY